jgi:hypothetical protein
MSFMDALRIAFSTGSGRKLPEGQSDNAEQVTWTYGIVGIAILVVVQAGLIVFTGGSDLGGEALRDLTIVAIVCVAAPFIIMYAAGTIAKTTPRLPAAFLYLGIVLAFLQVLSAVMSTFGSSTSGFLIGLLAAVNFLAARNFLKLGWPGALLVTILIVAAFVGAGLLLFALPTGRMLT